MIYSKPSKYGDMKKFTVTIDGKDVSDAVHAAQVFQDIFTPTWSAQINFNDTANLLMTLPIKVGSKVVISVATENDSVADGDEDFDFTVYRIGDKQFQNHMQQSYTVFCADQAFLDNSTKRVQRSYSNMKATDAVQSLVNEYFGGTVDVVDSENSIHVVVPNWNPFITASWFVKVAMKDSAADYVFFQRDNNQWVMKPSEFLYSDDSESTGITFEQVPGEMKQDGEYSHDYSFNILDYQFEHFDGLANQSSGFYKNTLVSYDLINKNWSSKVFSFGDDSPLDKAMKSWDNPVFEDGAENANISFMPKHPGMSQFNTVVDSAEQWQTSRKSSIQKLDQEKLLIQTAGNIGTKKWIGKNVMVKLPSQEDMSGETFDTQRQGRYLITAIVHMLNKDTYTNNFELVKKRLEESLV